jgi:glycosyltransferase involved in cell wall biosynthesis
MGADNRNNPLVSIVTPVRNEVKYLEACLDSVLKQSYTNIEQLFIDGGSTDGTLDLLVSYQARYPDRIRYISEPDNGVGDALNKGLKMAKGEICGWLDTDGIYESDAIMTVVDFFRANPEANVLVGGSKTINERGKVIGELLPNRDINLETLIHGTCCIPFASFYRRGVFDKVGYFNDLGSDFEFWIRVVKVFKVHTVRKVLVGEKLRPNNVNFSDDPGKKKMRRTRWKQDYKLCRQYGAGIFSTHVRRCVLFLVMDTLGLHTLLTPVLLRWVRRSFLFDKLVRSLVGY